MSIIGAFLQQWRKPVGLMGRAAVWSMNKTHAALADWGLAHISIEEDWIILDVGCGGGIAARKMASMVPGGKVYGVDYSEASVAESCRTNRGFLHSGRVEIGQAEVSSLPFPDGIFDLATAIDSHYYWPDLPTDLREVRRVIRQGGNVAIIGEGYRGGVFGRFFRAWVKEFKVTETSAHGLAEQLSKAGFSESRSFTHSTMNWICVVAKKL